MSTGTSSSLASELRGIVGEGYVHDAPSEIIAYSYDGTFQQRRPDLAVSPATTEEVAAVVKIAAREERPIVARGASSGLAGGTIPERGGIVLNLVRPRFFVPIHGEDRHLAHHIRLAQEVGLPEENVMLAGDGAVLEVAENHFQQSGRIDAGYVYVDGLGIGDVGSVVLRDRKHLGQDGIFVMVVSVDHLNGEMVGRPDVVTRGFVHVGGSEALIEAAKDEVVGLVTRTPRDKFEPALLQENIKDLLGKYLYQRTKRRPMVLPVIVEV